MSDSWLDNHKIDDRLLVSETSLAYIPRDKFHVNSWTIFDEFMVYATDVFAATLANLIEVGYIRILEKEVKSFKPLGITISTNTNYLIQLTKKPSKELIVGSLEEKIIEQFKYSTNIYLDKLINSTLSEIFDNNYNLTNPGKVLVLEIIRNQKLNLYEFNHTKNWISNNVTLWYNKNSDSQLNPRIYKIEDFVLSEIEISILKKIVSSQLRKFQNLD